MPFLKHPANHIFEFTLETLQAWTGERGMPKFRAEQLLDWVYVKGVCDPAQMTNLSKRDRDLLSDPQEGITFLSGSIVSHQSASDGVQKLLIEWDDYSAQSSGQPSARSDSSIALRVMGSGGAGDSAKQTECVMIPADDRRTACISSQIGCPVGCKFCASGIGGLDGNLSAGRIIEQVWRLGRLPEVDRISNVVFMGMGEPLSNFQAVMSAVRRLATLPPAGLGISARKITISTVGLPHAIEKLARELELPVTLALSLHAPNDELRSQLIPWAEYTNIPELLEACQAWFAKTGREITLEYILLGGVNDRPEHARELAELAKTIRANVNLIRYNEVKGMPFDRPDDDAVRVFQDILRAKHVNTHIRASRGRDIAAACGQLRHEKNG